MPEFFQRGYHSLAAKEDTLPAELVVTAEQRTERSWQWSTENYPIYGLTVSSGISYDTGRKENDRELYEGYETEEELTKSRNRKEEK